MKLAITLLSLVILGFVINVIGQIKEKKALIIISRVFCFIIVAVFSIGYFLLR